MLGVNHSQDPYFAGAVGHGVLVLELVKLVVYVFVKGIVFRLLGPLLVFFGRIQVGHQPVPTLVSLGVRNSLSLGGVLDRRSERPRPLTLEINRLRLRRVDHNLALFLVVEHVLHKLHQLWLARKRLDDLIFHKLRREVLAPLVLTSYMLTSSHRWTHWLVHRRLVHPMLL